MTLRVQIPPPASCLWCKILYFVYINGRKNYINKGTNLKANHFKNTPEMVTGDLRESRNKPLSHASMA